MQTRPPTVSAVPPVPRPPWCERQPESCLSAGTGTPRGRVSRGLCFIFKHLLPKKILSSTSPRAVGLGFSWFAVRTVEELTPRSISR